MNVSPRLGDVPPFATTRRRNHAPSALSHPLDAFELEQRRVAGGALAPRVLEPLVSLTLHAWRSVESDEALRATPRLAALAAQHASARVRFQVVVIGEFGVVVVVVDVVVVIDVVVAIVVEFVVAIVVVVVVVVVVIVGVVNIIIVIVIVVIVGGVVLNARKNARNGDDRPAAASGARGARLGSRSTTRAAPCVRQRIETRDEPTADTV